LNIATYLQQKGELQQAVARYQSVLDMTSDLSLRARAFSNLGSAYRSLGQYADAQQSYEAALRLVPETPHAAIGLGLLAQKSGNLSEAAREYERAAAIQPTALNYLLLAQALRRSGHAAEAQAAYQSAQQLSPDLTQTQQMVNQLLGQ
jgi:tetratricopeptide (TPR) repeat protein